MRSSKRNWRRRAQKCNLIFINVEKDDMMSIGIAMANREKVEPCKSLENF